MMSQLQLILFVVITDVKGHTFRLHGVMKILLKTGTWYEITFGLKVWFFSKASCIHERAGVSSLLG